MEQSNRQHWVWPAQKIGAFARRDVSESFPALIESFRVYSARNHALIQAAFERAIASKAKRDC